MTLTVLQQPVVTRIMFARAFSSFISVPERVCVAQNTWYVVAGVSPVKVTVATLPVDAAEKRCARIPFTEVGESLSRKAPQ
jgi:hypothetical protein